MRIINTSMLQKFGRGRRAGEAALRAWAQQAQAAAWQDFAEVRKTFPSADQVTVANTRTVVVFNIACHRYRLIVAIHYHTRIVYPLMILTHKQYDRDIWKERL